MLAKAKKMLVKNLSLGAKYISILFNYVKVAFL